MTQSIKGMQAYIGHGKKEKRADNDFYATPDNAITALLQREKFEGDIWEPACGDGALSKRLIAEGYNVYSTDLVDRGYGDEHYDFLTSRRECDNIITNPPFNLGTKFTIHALNCARKKVVMFNKLTFLEGKQRRDQLFCRNHLQSVYVFSERVTFSRIYEGQLQKAGGMLAFAWFVFDKQYDGKPRLEWI